MGLLRRIEHLEEGGVRRACSGDHVAISVTTVDLNGRVQAGPAPVPCRVCGQAREPFHLIIETSPDATGGEHR